MPQTKPAPSWPVNELGEVVAQAGTGTTNVVSFLAQDNIPVDFVTGKFAIVGAGGGAKPVPAQITASRNLVDADDGNTLYSTSASAFTLTVNAGLPVGFGVAVVQRSTGQVTFAPGAGVTITNVNGYTKTAAIYAAIGIVQTSPDNYTLVGAGAT